MAKRSIIARTCIYKRAIAYLRGIEMWRKRIRTISRTKNVATPYIEDGKNACTCHRQWCTLQRRTSTRTSVKTPSTVFRLPQLVRQ